MSQNRDDEESLATINDSRNQSIFVALNIENSIAAYQIR